MNGLKGYALTELMVSSFLGVLLLSELLTFRNTLGGWIGSLSSRAALLRETNISRVWLAIDWANSSGSTFGADRFSLQKKKGNVRFEPKNGRLIRIDEGATRYETTVSTGLDRFEVAALAKGGHRFQWEFSHGNEAMRVEGIITSAGP